MDAATKMLKLYFSPSLVLRTIYDSGQGQKGIWTNDDVIPCSILAARKNGREKKSRRANRENRCVQFFGGRKEEERGRKIVGDAWRWWWYMNGKIFVLNLGKTKHLENNSEATREQKIHHIFTRNFKPRLQKRMTQSFKSLARSGSD